MYVQNSQNKSRVTFGTTNPFSVPAMCGPVGNELLEEAGDGPSPGAESIAWQ